MDIGHHRRKWQSPILGVARIVLRDVFLVSIFSCVRGTKTFLLSRRKILQCSPYLRHTAAALHSNPPYLAQIMGFGLKCRGCTQEFSRAKKKEFWFHIHKKRGTKLREPAEPHPMFTPVVNRRFFIRPPQQILPLAILLSPHY